ncbi:MAG: glycosyltransferase family 4 protein [Thaumarchaeota archaeon]|nr:glycosyltransferase family 4 protein [Nitrososphaerota archaeon]
MGGAEQILERLMDYLTPRHEITVYTSNAINLESFWNDKLKTANDLQTKKYSIKRFDVLQPHLVSDDLIQHPLSVSYPGPFCPQMWNDLLDMRDKTDLMIASSFPYDHMIPAFVASKKYKIPFVVIPFLHLQYPEYYFTGTKLAILNDSDAIIVMTNVEKQALLDHNISEEKIHIIPGMIDMNDHGQRKDLRNELKIDQDSVLVLFAGTMSYAKGVIHLVEALKKLWAKSPKFDLVLLGTNTVEFNEYIKKQSESILLHIHNLGVVSDDVKWDAFFSCDVFAMPSQSESLGLVYLEAWKFKKPVIGCNIPSVSEVIDDNVNGMLIPFGDVVKLYNSIEKLQDDALRQQMGQKGYEKLKNFYDANMTCDKFESLCTKIQTKKLL